MAKRWHQTLVIILCVVILSICQSSAVPRRRILRPTGAVMKPGRNPGGVPVGQFRSYKQQKPQIPSMGTQFVRNVQTGPIQSRVITGSVTGTNREAVIAQLQKLARERLQNNIQQRGGIGRGKFVISGQTSRIIQQHVPPPRPPPPPPPAYDRNQYAKESKFTKQEQAQLLNVHNDVRRNLDPTPKAMLNLEWSEALAGKAQEYAEKCQWKHSDKHSRRDKLGYRFVGENLYISTSYGGTRSVNSWAAEKAFYNFWTNTCRPGEQCGHYTQMIWHNTNRVGCGYHFCKKVQFWTRGDAYYVVCNYGPGGNISGNRPYEAEQGGGTPKGSGSTKPDFRTKSGRRRSRRRRSRRGTKRRPRSK